MATKTRQQSPLPQHILDYSEIVVPAQQVDEAIQRLAQQINQLQLNTPLQVFCIMNGGLYFTGQLLRQLTIPLNIHYIHATRYGDQLQGAKLRWLVKPQPAAIQNQAVLLLDDIFDEGITLEAIVDECQQLGPQQLLSAVLVDKQHRRKPASGFQPDLVGLTVPDRYIFGCGMDYKGLWRNLPAIYALKD